MAHVDQGTSRALNGVDVDQLAQTVDLIRTQPALARFRFHFENRWLEGSRNRSTISSFFGAGQEHAHATTLELRNDEPPLLLGTDTDANPGEYLLHALTACVTSAIVYHAAARGIPIRRIESSIEGDVDLRGFLGLDDSIRNGFQEIRLKFRIEADVSEADLQALCDLGPTYSPVFDSVTRGLPVRVSAERLV